MVDDSRKNVTTGARGEFTMIGAQRHTSLTDPVTNSALARAALGCVLALAVLATPALAQAPAAVSDVVVVPVPRSSNSLTVSWSAPDNAGKPAITGYDVQYRETDTFNWALVSHNAASTSVIIASLRSNTFYDVQVRALNTDGSGPWSSIADVSTSPPSELVYANHPLIPTTSESATPSAFCSSLPIRRPPPARATKTTATSLLHPLITSLNPAISRMCVGWLP